MKIADTMQSWLETGASDGFNIMFPTVPAGLDDFCGACHPRAATPGVSSATSMQGPPCVSISVCHAPENQFFPPDDPRG